jgi:hypothetical protein
MAYISDGLSLRQSGLSGQGYNEWNLDGEDAPATARVSGYITDAAEKGVGVGDLVHLRQWTAYTDQYDRTGPVVAYQLMIVVSLAANGSADLSDGTAIDMTDTD